MPPKISIITVSYNAEAEIEKTIRSVYDQNFLDYEYVFIDGASKDGTVSIIEKYRRQFEAKGISYHVTSEKDRGIYDAMNKGVHQACGDWVLMLNAGDLFADNDVLKDIFSVPGLDGKIVYGDVVLSQVGGNKTYFQYQKPKAMESICHALPFCHQSVFVPCELMARYGFDTNFRIAADYNFFATVYSDGAEFRYIPRAVSIYDMSGISSVNAEKLFEEYGKIQKMHFPAVVQPEQQPVDGPVVLIKKFIKKLVPFLVYSPARGWNTSLTEVLKENKEKLI